ncbi:BLUF domain-containing protein [Rubellimicrobium rubrum]|nr:BLUF domain-containing protein [Rubellimicrobium rubrum]
MPLCRLVYASLRGPRSPSDLVKILETSEARNAVEAITGALVLTPDHYLQLLEGERRVVDACYQRICRDPRHSYVGLILFELIDERLFPDWSMSAVDLSEGDGMAPYTEGKEFRPEELPRAVIEQLFRDVAARLRRR